MRSVDRVMVMVAEAESIDDQFAIDCVARDGINLRFELTYCPPMGVREREREIARHDTCSFSGGDQRASKVIRD